VPRRFFKARSLQIHAAKSKETRNLQWLREVQSGRATVRQIAIREFVTPEAVLRALKIARLQGVDQ
jgi:hypothetical protein